ncbi:hypothetical protein RCL_jg29035.t1 [Rhizophagus clarus]|uniref:Uncharacterized protein n=1 Tax=Rhizophagus clarus TaxID=94130 RepID=A0A8H3R1R0_9GLOM|nr:hypothetical protein RCL_jg29035.t1 [Rhizophagus clarus]
MLYYGRYSLPPSISMTSPLGGYYRENSQPSPYYYEKQFIEYAFSRDAQYEVKRQKFEVYRSFNLVSSILKVDDKINTRLEMEEM